MIKCCVHIPNYIINALQPLDKWATSASFISVFECFVDKTATSVPLFNDYVCISVLVQLTTEQYHCCLKTTELEPGLPTSYPSPLA